MARRKGLLGRIARAFWSDRFEAEEEEAVAEEAESTGGMSDERMEAAAGDWVIEVQGTTMDFAITHEDGGLFAEPAGQSRILMAPTSDSTLTIAEAQATVTFHFEADGSVERATLSQGADMPMRRVENVTLTEGQLADFAGTYFSDELQTFYEVTVEDGSLKIHHLEMEPMALNHREGDTFSASAFFLATVEFKRTGNGAVTGFEASNGRTAGVWFRRQ